MHTTTAGKIKVSLALDPDAYQQLKDMAAGPRSVGVLLEDLIRAEVTRRENASREHALHPEMTQREMSPAEAAICLAAEKYRMLFESIDEGFCIIEVLFDENQRPLDYRFLEVNSAFERQTGIQDAVGRSMREIAPQHEAHWFEIYGKVALTGESIRFENPAEQLHRFYDVYAFRVGKPSDRQVAILFNDITERKQAVARQAAAQEEIRRLYGLAECELAERKQAQNRLADAVSRLERQSERLQILHEIDLAILAARSPGAIAEAAVQGVLHLTGAARVNVAIWQPQGDVVEMLATVGPEHPFLKPGNRIPMRPWPWLSEALQGRIWFDDDLLQEPNPSPEAQIAAAQGIRSRCTIPLMVGDRPIGHMAISRYAAGRLPDDDLALARQVADSLAVAIHNARLNAEVQDRRHQLQVLSRRMVELQEDERRVLSRDVHDTSGQSLTALKLGLGSLKRDEGSSEAVCSRVDELLQLADTVAQDLHRLAVNLRPASLDRYGLIPALEQLLTEFRKHTGLQLEFLAESMAGDRLAADIETALYRIVQEATTNIARYAQAASVSVMVKRDGDYVQVIVEDDGRGFDIDEALRGGRLGLLGMRERAEMLGGVLEIESRPGHGTCVFATVPARETGIQGAAPPQIREKL